MKIIKYILLLYTTIIFFPFASGGVTYGNLLILPVTTDSKAEQVLSYTEELLKEAVLTSSYVYVDRASLGTPEEFKKAAANKSIKNAQYFLKTAVRGEYGKDGVTLSIVSVQEARVIYSTTIRTGINNERRFTKAISEFLKKSYAFVPTVQKKKERKLVAVITDFEVKGTSASKGLIITDMLREEVIKQKKFTVIDRASMKEILAEQSLQESGCTSSECKVQIGQLLNAHRVISGSIVNEDGDLHVSVKILDVENAKIINFVKKNIGDVRTADKNVEELARELTETFQERLTKSYKRKQNAKAHVFLAGGTTVVGLAGSIVFHVLAANTTSEIRSFWETSYKDASTIDDATDAGDRLDKDIKNSDMLYYARDIFISASILAAAYEVLSVITYKQMSDRYEYEKKMNVALMSDSESTAVQLSWRF
jgi:TolB-like protein